MAPQSESSTSQTVDPGAAVAAAGNGTYKEATQQTAHSNREGSATRGIVPMIPTFEDRYKERQYQKERLALAFRIFAKLGFDEGVAGHITLRVRSPFSFLMSLLFYMKLRNNFSTSYIKVLSIVQNI